MQYKIPGNTRCNTSSINTNTIPTPFFREQHELVNNPIVVLKVASPPPTSTLNYSCSARCS